MSKRQSIVETFNHEAAAQNELERELSIVAAEQNYQDLKQNNEIPADADFDLLSMNGTDINELETPEMSAPVNATEMNEAEQIVTIQKMKEQDFNAIVVAVSRDLDKYYSPKQFGERIFTAEEIIFFCYRYDLDLSDKEILNRLSKMVRHGQLVKQGRGKYQAAELLRVDVEKLINSVKDEFKGAGFTVR